MEALNLRFPIAEIVDKTGANKGNVSAYLKGAKPISENFLKTFYGKFPLPVNNQHNKGNAGSEPELIHVILERIASLTKTQNLILEQNQVQIVDGIKKIQTDITQSMIDNQGRASAIIDEIQNWSLPILKALKAPIPSGPAKPSGKNAGKHNQKSEKPDNHTGVNK